MVWVEAKERWDEEGGMGDDEEVEPPSVMDFEKDILIGSLDSISRKMKKKISIFWKSTIFHAPEFE